MSDLHYVYVLQSIADPAQFCTGRTAHVDARLVAHNGGRSPHTAEYKPWRVTSSRYFERPEVAAAFARYRKSGSGRAFANKGLR